MQIPSFHTLLLEYKLSEYKNIQNLCIQKTYNNEKTNEIQINLLKRERDYLDIANTISNKKFKLNIPLESTRNLFPQFFQQHYEGDTLNGMRHGKGKLIFKSGDIYEGDFFNDMLHGKGKSIAKSGAICEGDFSNGKIHGKGKLIYTSSDIGDIYEGDFSNGKLHGKGKLIYKNGDIYEGNFSNNNLHGSGTLINNNIEYKVESENNKLISKTKS